MAHETPPRGLRPEDVRKVDPRDAEIARLRVLVEDAYREGFADGSAGGSAGMDRSWKRSAAYSEITP